MSRRRRTARHRAVRAAVLASVLAVLALASGGCGGPDPASTGPDLLPGGWRVAQLEGVEGASGVTVVGDLLAVVAGGGVQHVHLLERGALVHGATLRPGRYLPEVPRDRPLEGVVSAGRGDDLAVLGYRVGSLWDVLVDFQGIASRRIPGTQPGVPDYEALYLLDRAFGLIYRARVVRERGAVLGVKVDGAFPVPGRPRAGRERSDWRDSSAGLVGVVSIVRPGNDEDLYVVERAGDEPGSVRVQRIDRFGQAQGRFTVALGVTGAGAAPDTPPDVGDLAFHDGRFVLVEGAAPSRLLPVADPGDFGHVRAGSALPCPDLPDAGPWRGLAYAPDGTAYLVSAGRPSRIAWRR